MIEPRLTSEIQIAVLKRLAEAEGGFAVVLRKGDPTSGAIMLIGQVRGQNPVLFDRFPSADGRPIWRPTCKIDTEITDVWQRRAARDPDLWVIELDVASLERLAEITGTHY